MIDISLEKKIERYDLLPERLRQAMNSDEAANMVWLIGEVHHLDNKRIEKISKVIGYIMMGLIHPEDLSKEIIVETGIDRRLAEEIARELRLKILNPLMPDIEVMLGYHLTGTSPPTIDQPSATPAQPEVMRPTFEPLVQELGSRKQETAEDRPFILHEEQKETGSVRPIDETLVRPTFYEETSDKGQETSIERPLAARLEIGGVEEGPGAEPRVGRTEAEKVRVVHYSGPQTPVDPFSPATRDKRQETSPSQPPEEVHPENIVDLKDLPK